MINQPDNPQPTLSPEIQAKQLTQRLLSKLAELKKAYEPEKIQDLQLQLQEIGQQVSNVGTGLVIKELGQQRQSTYEEMVARSENGFKIMQTHITETIQKPSINTASMNYGWEKLPTNQAVDMFQNQPLRQAINKQQERTHEDLTTFHHNEAQLKLFFIDKMETISEARGFVINQSTKPQETK